MTKGDIWKLFHNRTNAVGRRLIFTNSTGKYIIDITVNPIVANRIIGKILKCTWERDDLIAYLDTMSGNIIEQDYHTCEV